MTPTTQSKTVSIGPIRIPRKYDELLVTLLKPHVTKSDLVREALYLLLIREGLIEDE